MLGGWGTYNGMSKSVTRWTPLDRSQRVRGAAECIANPDGRERATLCPNREENKAPSMGNK